ncbi:hypothetical protein D9613_009941 [Agrocybe pediades]|uniref:GPI transamidase component PIG-S n=1 Tax=Agrocybe pediades TaxID=84607 RepID=A0A8H4VSP4_9AGAR|nr:hypothetical protein D9613_009941 [Agrocybe pediades]
MSEKFTFTTVAVKLADLLESLLAPYSKDNDPERRAAQYSSRYRLAFSLLNEDSAAGGGVLDWDIRTELKAYIHPIHRRIAPLHNFTIESQVQFHAPLAFVPQKVEDVYGLTPEQLTVFVNSAEWILSSSSSNDPVLHFVLFVPSSDRRPLQILNRNGVPSQSNAFLLPQWGGIVVSNPSAAALSDDRLLRHEMDNVFSVFAHQLLALLGVSPLPTDVVTSTKQDSLLSEWQLDALARRRTLENVHDSQDTLLSIVKLVDQIENMPVHDGVKTDVEEALNALASMYDSPTSSLYQKFAYSAKSFGLASRAFFNPGMLALLYFPAEHKYAIYSPLFASAVIPLLVAALRELLALRKERKQAKHAAQRPAGSADL